MFKQFRLIHLIIFLCLSIFAFSAHSSAQKKDSLLKVYLLDVGKGDAIFIEAPNGNQVLIDGGPNKAVLIELAKQMPFYDRTVDGIVLTHPHLDHYGGLVDVLDNYKINSEMDSGNNNPESKGFDIYAKKLEEE